MYIMVSKGGFWCQQHIDINKDALLDHRSKTIDGWQRDKHNFDPKHFMYDYNHKLARVFFQIKTGLFNFDLHIIVTTMDKYG